MKSEDNFFNFNKSIFKTDLMTQKNLSSNKNNKSNNIQLVSHYLCLNSPEKDNENSSLIKDESEYENDINIDNFLTKDIINSINEINSDSNNNSYKNDSKKEILMQDKAESYGDETDSSRKKSEDDNMNANELKIEKEIKNEFFSNFDNNISSNFLIKNSLTLSAGERGIINHYNRHLNNNINIINENEKNNRWNFNTSPRKIFNIDNNKKTQNDKESHKLNDNDIHLNNDKSKLENISIIKNKEKTGLNMTYQKNEISNIEYVKINNEGCLENKELLDNNFINQEYSIFENQDSYINLDNNIDNKQNQNNYIENSFIYKENKIMNNHSEQKELYNKFNINNINLNDESNELSKEHSNTLGNNNNFYLYKNNKYINYNNYINIIGPIYQNNKIKFDSHDETNNNVNSLEKDKDNLNPENYLISMFGKMGWLCRICDNFNFEARNICNRCKALKKPRTKEEIKQKEKILKITKKKIKDKKTDWICPYCQNINYSFRKNCNRCQTERKKEFPAIYSLYNQKTINKNNNINITRNIGESENINN